jgi:hypothetical protein
MNTCLNEMEGGITDREYKIITFVEYVNYW